MAKQGVNIKHVSWLIGGLVHLVKCEVRTISLGLIGGLVD